MTIAQAFNEIAAAQGGTPNNSGTIAGAIDALNDALAGSDQEAASTIEGAVRMLGSHIGGGSSVTVEALTATENKTYTAPEGKAYSPVTVNVPSVTKKTITCVDASTHEPVADCLSDTVEYDSVAYMWYGTGAVVTSAYPGAIVAIPEDAQYGIQGVFSTNDELLIYTNYCFIMPNDNVTVEIG